jgi:cardiolipin synthase
MFYGQNSYPLRSNNAVAFLYNGNAFFNTLKQLIQQAQKLIHFQVYIFNEDKTGKEIAAILEAAAKRGVKVYMVLDAYGSNALSDEFVNYLKSFCTFFKFFSPLFYKYHFNIGLRMHHKIFIADGFAALTGGINIANKYSGIDYKHQWLDFGIYITGEAVTDLEKICWNVINRNALAKKLEPQYVKQNNSFGSSIPIQVLQNDKYRNKLGVTRFYRQQIRKSKDEILIVSSYFLPSNSFRRLLRNAAKRGVKIKLVLGEKSDTNLVLRATKYFYKSLLTQGIEIFEWQQSVLHGKLGIFDNKVVTVGSYNLNALSDFGSLECNIAVYEKEFAEQVNLNLHRQVINQCSKVDANLYLKNLTLGVRIINWLSYRLLLLLLGYLVFLQKKNAYKLLKDTDTQER